MLEIIPTYHVTYNPAAQTNCWRITEADLETFIRVIRLNGVHDFTVVREKV